ncbi:MAG: serpin family protein [Erysipelotrichaceae bacterium]|nr:serpin family protein [Erysipelotrichaceae bacterium]
MKKIKIISVLCALALTAGCGTKPAEIQETKEPDSTSTAEVSTEPGTEEVKMVKAVYPGAEAEGVSAEAFIMGDSHWDWWQSYRETVNASSRLQQNMDEYYAAIQKELLVTEDNRNTVCSPLNIYIALSMLSEVSDGNTRAQIMDVLKASDIDSLRSRASAMWKANYLDTPSVKSILADSMWLRNDITYNEETLQRLADIYYASSFCGEMGSAELDRQLQEWTDENTGGLLSDYTKDMKLDERTILGLVSTIYFKASWSERFSPERTDTAVFHGADGDTDVQMMHRDLMMSLYQTDHFRAVGLNLTDSGTMYFFLPEEGTDVKDLAADPDALSICRNNWAGDAGFPIVHLSVPKFKVSGKTDLIESLKHLGIIDALDPDAADFTPLTDEAEQIFVNAAEHAAMVEIDEDGVTGAAYTELAMAGAGMPQEETDFVLDRPFFFTVVSPDNSLLFSGIVQTIE